MTSVGRTRAAAALRGSTCETITPLCAEAARASGAERLCTVKPRSPGSVEAGGAVSAAAINICAGWTVTRPDDSSASPTNVASSVKMADPGDSVCWTDAMESMESPVPGSWKRSVRPTYTGLTAAPCDVASTTTT